MLDPSSSQPLYLQLQARIRGRIASGELAPGDRIESEVVLARLCGISRMTVRRAIDQLVEEGVLYRQPSKGTYVAGLYSRRQGFIGLSFSHTLRARGYTVYDEFLTRALVAPPASTARDLDLEPDALAVCIRRLRNVEGQPVMIETSWLPPLFTPVIDADLATQSLHTVMEEAGHLRLVHSQEHLWAGKASEEDARLLRLAPGDPVFWEHGLVLGEGGIPVRSTDLVLSGSWFRFSLIGGGGLQMKSPTSAPGDADEWWMPMWMWPSR